MSKSFSIHYAFKFDNKIVQLLKLEKNFKKAASYKIEDDVNEMRKLDVILEAVFSGARYKGASKNARLTALLKHHNKPFLDSGDFIYNAMKVRGKTTNSWFKIILYIDPKHPKHNLFQLMSQQDIEIPVTQDMRSMFMALASASQTGDSSQLTGRALELWKINKEWYPLKDDTTKIIIPRRNYWEVLGKSKKLEHFMTALAKRFMKRILNTIKNG